MHPWIRTTGFVAAAAFALLPAAGALGQAPPIKIAFITSYSGPLEIDARNRDIVQTVYIRRTEKRNGKYVNVEIAAYPRSTDPLAK